MERNGNTEGFRMYITVEDFIKEWNREALLTQKVLEGLTDQALTQKVYAEGRTLGRIVWHFTTNIPDYLVHFGVEIAKLENAEHMPSCAKEFVETFNKISLQVAKAISQQWTDETLKEVQTAFGRQETNAQIFMGLIKHIIHHRGQVTVLIRQAGLEPFGVYGPTKEEWQGKGVKNPPL